MPYILEDLVIDRVDLVDKGANSAAFVELYKRKEQGVQMNFAEIMSKIKPEHAAVIQKALDASNGDLAKAREDLDKANEALSKANDALTKANEELNTLKSKDCSCNGEADEKGVCKSCGKPKKNLSFDESEVLKSMPEAARSMFIKMREQKEAAEEQVRKNAEEQKEAEAVSKAATMKSLPIEQAKLVDILKSCPEEVVDLLKAASDAIDATVLTEEVGKSAHKTNDGNAWAKIEVKADEIAKRDSVTKQKAIATAIQENPGLYREYLNGGAN